MPVAGLLCAAQAEAEGAPGVVVGESIERHEAGEAAELGDRRERVSSQAWRAVDVQSTCRSWADHRSWV